MCAPKVVSNWKLLMILAIVVSVGVVLLMIGTAVSEIRYEAREELVRCVGGRKVGCLCNEFHYLCLFSPR